VKRRRNGALLTQASEGAVVERATAALEALLAEFARTTAGKPIVS